MIGRLSLKYNSTLAIYRESAEFRKKIAHSQKDTRLCIADLHAPLLRLFQETEPRGIGKYHPKEIYADLSIKGNIDEPIDRQLEFLITP